MEPVETFLAHVQPLEVQLTAYARRMLRDPRAVEDVLQATLQTAYAKFNLYAEGTNFRAWIFQILTHTIFNANRKHERVERMEISLEAGGEDLVAALERELDYDRFLAAPETLFEHLDSTLAKAVSGLPPLERGALLLRAIAGLSYKEIAQTLEIPVGSALGYLSRARATLRRDLSTYAAEKGLLGRRASP